MNFILGTKALRQRNGELTTEVDMVSNLLEEMLSGHDQQTSEDRKVGDTSDGDLRRIMEELGECTRLRGLLRIIE